jgi:hypothetical protein
MVKNMQPVDDEDEDAEDNSYVGRGDSSQITISKAEKHDSASSTRAGSLELRLQPTMNSESRPRTADSQKTKGGSSHAPESHHFRLFQSNSKNSSTSRFSSTKTMGKKASVESLQSSTGSRPTIGRSSTVNSLQDAQSINSESKSKRFGIHRNGNKKKEQPSDDLTKMMSRASEYMTLAYVKIPSVVLCLSYKGKGERNIEDVHDFVFRLPEIEYRNKTWSNLDLALALKKDVIRALISHTGAIIGNKFSKHRPSTAQQNRLRELATSSMVLAPSTQDNSRDNSDTSSAFGTSPTGAFRSERSRSPRRSYASSDNRLTRTPSASSSVISLPSSGPKRVPSGLMMTPASHHRPSSRPSSVAESETTRSESIKNGLDGGFVASTLNRLKKKDKDSPSPASNGQDETEDTSRRKSKSLKHILSGMS